MLKTLASSKRKPRQNCQRHIKVFDESLTPAGMMFDVPLRDLIEVLLRFVGYTYRNFNRL